MSLVTSCHYVTLLSGLALAAGCSQSDAYPNRPITLVCPWAAGGGTDRCSRQIAAHLEVELGVPVSVINATGGKGVTGHSRGLNARPDGYTLQMATLELNMLHWSGLTGLTYADCIPLMSINEDYAALFVAGDAPWESVEELEADIAANPKGLKASGTASGGAWHLALAGWLLAAGLEADDVVWISSTGANPSLQELMSGGVDMVCCSLPEATTLLESGAIRPLGVMSPQPVPGYEEVPTFAEQGRDWSLGGWRGIVVPLGTPEFIVETLTTALTNIVTGETTVVSRTHDDAADAPTRQTFPEFMEAAGFDHTFRPRDEFRTFMAETDEKFGKLLTSDAMRSVNRDRYDAMAWPWILISATGVLLILIGLQRVREQRIRTTIPASDSDPSPTPSRKSRVHPPGQWPHFALIVGTIVLYILLAETVGFVPLAAVLLFVMLKWLGTRLWVSTLVTLLFVPLCWQLFVGLLRVPLPRGWWGW